MNLKKNQTSIFPPFFKVFFLLSNIVFTNTQQNIKQSSYSKMCAMKLNQTSEPNKINKLVSGTLYTMMEKYVNMIVAEHNIKGIDQIYYCFAALVLVA